MDCHVHSNPGVFRLSRFGALVALCLVASLLTTGCENRGPKGALKGMVTYKGDPVPAGTIIFQYQSDKGPDTAMMDINADGTFAAADLPVGSAQVTVTTELLKPTPGVVPNAPPPPGLAIK